MYGYRDRWSLRAEIMIIFEVMTDIHTTPNSTYRLGPSGRMGRVKIYAIVKTHANVKEHVSQWTCLFIAHKAQCTCSRRVSNDRWSGLILFASVVAKWRRYRHQQRGAQLALDTVSILVKKAKTVSDNDTYYVCTFSDVRCTLYSVAVLGKYPHYCWIQAISGSQLFVDNCNTCASYLSSGFWLCNLTQR